MEADLSIFVVIFIVNIYYTLVGPYVRLYKERLKSKPTKIPSGIDYNYWSKDF